MTNPPSVRTLIATILLGIAATGCSTPPAQPKEEGVTAAAMIEARMKQAAEAQAELASIAVAKSAPRRDPTDIFSDRITLDYVGDVEGVLLRVARQYQMKLEILGKRPPEGLMVNVLVKEPKPVIDVVKAVALQFPSMMDVHVTKTTIELTYKTKG